MNMEVVYILCIELVFLKQGVLSADIQMIPITVMPSGMIQGLSLAGDMQFI